MGFATFLASADFGCPDAVSLGFVPLLVRAGLGAGRGVPTMGIARLLAPASKSHLASTSRSASRGS
jgi:hypothetical protein